MRTQVLSIVSAAGILLAAGLSIPASAEVNGSGSTVCAMNEAIDYGTTECVKLPQFQHSRDFMGSFGHHHQNRGYQGY